MNAVAHFSASIALSNASLAYHAQMRAFEWTGNLIHRANAEASMDMRDAINNTIDRIEANMIPIEVEVATEKADAYDRNLFATTSIDKVAAAMVQAIA